MALGNGFFSRLFGKNKEEDDFFTEYAIEMDDPFVSIGTAPEGTAGAADPLPDYVPECQR